MVRVKENSVAVKDGKALPKKSKEKKLPVMEKKMPADGGEEKKSSRIKDKLKIEIVKTAKLLLSEGKDIRLITMNLIAKRMDITAPTLYHYFKGKEEIIMLSLELICDELLETFEAPLPATMNQEMKLKMRIVTLMTYLYKNLNSFSLIFSDAGMGYWGSGNIMLTDKIKKFRDLLDLQVKQYLESEKIKFASLKATFLLLSIMMGSLRYFKDEKIKNADISKECEVVFNFFKNGLKKSPEA